MRRCWSYWVDVTSRRERGTTIAAFRIAVGAVLLGSLASVALSGVLPLVWLGPEHGGLREVRSGHVVMEWLGGPSPTTVWGLVVVGMLAAGAMIVGFGGRLPIVVAIVGYRAVSTLSGHGSYDHMLTNAAWLLVLSQSTATLSLDCRLARGRWLHDGAIPAWPRYLLVTQLAFVYGFSALQKSSLTWSASQGYSALYWFLQDPRWQRWEPTAGLAAELYPLTQVATFVVWFFELLFPVLLLAAYFRDTPGRPGRVRALFNRFDLRVPFTVVGIGMHLGIELLMNLGPFSWISLAYYLCLWHPSELRSAALAMFRRIARPQPEAATTG